MSCKQECPSAGFENETVELKPGMVPDTYTFKCPGNMCQDKRNNNKPEPQPPTNACRPMPKTSKCPAPEPKKTVDQCEEAPKPKPAEETCRPDVPDTQTFEYVEPPPEEVCPDHKNRTCGTPLSPVGGGKRCKCGGSVPPLPKVKPCGCGNKGGINCGPNTSCEVLPLTMKKTK